MPSLNNKFIIMLSYTLILHSSNIKSGVKIFNVTGSMSEGINVNDYIEKSFTLNNQNSTTATSKTKSVGSTSSTVTLSVTASAKPKVIVIYRQGLGLGTYGITGAGATAYAWVPDLHYSYVVYSKYNTNTASPDGVYYTVTDTFTLPSSVTCTNEAYNNLFIKSGIFYGNSDMSTTANPVFSLNGNTVTATVVALNAIYVASGGASTTTIGLVVYC